MTKKTRQAVLSLWILVTSGLDLWLAWFTGTLIAFWNYAGDRPPYYEETPYRLPIDRLVFNQFSISILCLLCGIAWSLMILISSERLLGFLQFPTPTNNKFSHLSLGLFKLALVVVALTQIVSNGYMIYDQIHGRGSINLK